MSDSHRGDAALSIVTADLTSTERDMCARGIGDLTEAKEAIVDGLLGLTLAYCSGEGPIGEVILGSKPSGRLVSGVLLPRFDQAGDDETSDIHLATMGLDVQLAAESVGTVVVQPAFSIYVRELPSWDELSDPRHDMMPQILLSRVTRQQVETLARSYIDEALAALPAVADEEPDERSGDAEAEADQARERADVAAENVEPGDAETRGEAQAAAQAADRAEQAAAGRAAASIRRREERLERGRQRTAIRRAAFDRAFRELGITLRPADDQDHAARPLTADDMIEAEVSDTAMTDVPEPEPEMTDAGDGEQGPPVASGAIGALRPDAGRLEDRHAAAQAIPQKWRRHILRLDPVTLAIADPAARLSACAGFAAQVTAEVDRVLVAWLATPEGQRDAYRRDEHILPSQFADRAAWDAYLDSLRQRKPATLDDVRPRLAGVNLVAEVDPDFVDQSRVNMRVAIENGALQPATRHLSGFEHGIFQVKLTATIAALDHRPLRLDRVKPSYRFRDWLEYPAMGLNCGVEDISANAAAVVLETTWAPRYCQPRIDPRDIPGVPTGYAALSDPATPLEQLFALPDAYDVWIGAQVGLDVEHDLEPAQATQERAAHSRDLEAYRRESGYIRAGVRLLIASREADAAQATERDPARRAALARQAAPWRAWLHTNETFAQYGGARYTDWRLFQLAFILAHIPTLASRMPDFADHFDAFRDELSASLLYFPTGGGKSEAFFGLLIFNLFLDRLRGKTRGVTALVRYPLRLLTLQQARRLLKVLVRAELVRLAQRIGGWPFEIGFWVGSGNTPNRAAQGFGGVPTITMAAYPDDQALLNPPEGTSPAAAVARRRSNRYREALEAFDKLRVCPICQSPTGMRKYPAQFGRIGIVCFNDTTCAWNLAHPAAPTRTPLPFLLTDDTIYQRAPSVILGTIDKLALIGQHDRTINAIVGMFGAARYRDPTSGHLFMPRTGPQLERAEDDGWERVWPAFAAGVTLFHDPFPSLVIQDEGHLLDESLGTFSGLFETVFERIQLRLGAGVLGAQCAHWRENGDAAPRPRLAKVIAATATISDPDRQLRVLYQRESLRFPCPGPGLYDSFFSASREPLRPERRAYAQSLPELLRPERSAPRMRTYVSVMTNGRSHTMTTSAVVSAYHLAFTQLWQAAEAGDAPALVADLVAGLPAHDPLTPLRAAALQDLVASPDVLATLLDLQRISLTYVTNKKGGDQIIETLASQVDRDQRAAGIGDLPFATELISGGVTIAEIQDVMEQAEGQGRAGAPFLPLSEALRNIVATSAISHGVDVDKFNAMFFAGLPADIAEYIQASSRVGRNHVGFSMLVPTPHSRRDRYVVETHDQFHRFLERMIPAPAVQRWAERAIRRIIPSILQAYLCGVVEQEAFERAPENAKDSARSFRTAAAIKSWSDRHVGSGAGAIAALTEFALEGIGVDGRSATRIGAAPHDAYYRQFVQDRVRMLLDVFTQRSDASLLANFWQSRESPTVRRPMTSLRDVDSGGIILAATRDPYRNRSVNLETVRQVMKIIRGQRLAVRTDVDADPAPIDTED
ncbi:MAG: hypothetical protein ABS87_10100 [Sphingomonas sp. SCN 67-18]|nr:helicase-related protein [Sphingomonas sp. SCN 67-18]ODU20402.1 MAG: hypothetical protein ABS87_10100 [Sphingomonas sp. SCN 67-18]